MAAGTDQCAVVKGEFSEKVCVFSSRLIICIFYIALLRFSLFTDLVDLFNSAATILLKHRVIYAMLTRIILKCQVMCE
jgi:hypothetical protein